MNSIHAIEKAIECKLTREAINMLSIKELEKISFAVNEIERKPFIPIKKEGEFRPYLSYGVIESDLSKSCVACSIDEVSNNCLVNLKKYLLYCDSLVFYDPLVYHLDYVRFSSDDSNRIMIIKAILNQYAELRDLMYDNIIIPITAASHPVSDNIFYNSKEENEGLSKLKLNEIEDSDLKIYKEYMYPIIKKQLWYKSYFDSNIDIALRDKSQFELFTKMHEYLRCENYDTSTDLRSMAKVLSYDIFDPNRITYENIINLRNNEEAFEIIRRSIRNLSKTNLESENDYTIRQMLIEDLELYNKAIKKSSVLTEYSYGAVKEFIIGAFQSTIPSILTGSLTTLATGSVLSGASTAGLNYLISECITKSMSSKNKVDQTIRDNFLVMIK